MSLKHLTSEELVSFTDSRTNNTELEEALSDKLKDTLDESYAKGKQLDEVRHIVSDDDQQELL
ncbi:hypothetical protein vBAmePPT11V19_00052 [Alteromonas phage vB_AmeP_PT11-V19]|nr:hypothetical protein vBAmePPT11V19_00052 [Alteromonas phage vB_AmeP_PT11-V19]